MKWKSQPKYHLQNDRYRLIDDYVKNKIKKCKSILKQIKILKSVCLGQGRVSDWVFSTMEIPERH